MCFLHVVELTGNQTTGNPVNAGPMLSSVGPFFSRTQSNRTMLSQCPPLPIGDMPTATSGHGKYGSTLREKLVAPT